MAEINPKENYVYCNADSRFFVSSGIATGEFLQEMLKRSPGIEYFLQKELNKQLIKS